MAIGEGDMVAVYATYTGTMTGPLGDLPPTGKSMESKFITIFRIEEDRIAELWVEWDNVAMLTQLGHFPPAGGADDPPGN
jgi:predicted ester cyclase